MSGTCPHRYLPFWVLAMFAAAIPAVADADDAGDGARQFNKCIACHSMEPGAHLAGPSLAGLLGRRVGGAEGFLYSPAMEEAGFAWTAEKLDAFLADPQALIPGNTMPFGGMRNPGQRNALIRFFANQ